MGMSNKHRVNDSLMNTRNLDYSKWKIVGVNFLKLVGNIFYVLLGVLGVLGLTLILGYGIVQLTLGDSEQFKMCLLYFAILLIVMIVILYVLGKIKFRGYEEYIVEKEGVLYKDAVILEDKSKGRYVLKSLLWGVLVIMMIAVIGIIFLYLVAGIINNGDVHGMIQELF